MNEQENGLTILFDYDSLVYKSVYKIVTFGQIKEWFEDGRTKEWMETEIVNLATNRLIQMGDGIFIEIEETSIEITSIEYYLTASKDPYRKRINPDYKANRKKNKWVNLVRKYMIEMNFATTHNEYEADDLISDRTIELGPLKCVILSLDKDMKTIPGIHFDYWRERLLDEEGNPQLDENGFRKVAPCRGLSIITPEEADRFFWAQMIAGDPGDNIKGAVGFGSTKVDGILDCDPKQYSLNVMKTYIEAEFKKTKKEMNKTDAKIKKTSYKDWLVLVESGTIDICNTEIKTNAGRNYNLNYQLLKLGIKDRIKLITK